MTIERTEPMHFVFSVKFFEAMSDAELKKCFKGGNAKEIRRHLAALKIQGYEYVPCPCGKYDATGRCTAYAK